MGVPCLRARTAVFTRCLVNAVNAREFCKRLEADLAAGRNEQECRGMVKAVLRGLTLQESVKDAVLYLPKGKRQVGAGSSCWPCDTSRKQARPPVQNQSLPFAPDTFPSKRGRGVTIRTLGQACLES